MNRLVTVVWLLLVSMAMAAGEGTLRKWTDVQGRVIEAVLVSVQSDSVTLQKVDNGKQYDVPFSKLSDADRQWLRAQNADLDVGVAAGASSQPPGKDFSVDGVLDSLNLSVAWIIGILILNVPLFFFWIHVFFGDFHGFMEALRYKFQPDMISMYRGEYGADMWAEFKLFIFGFWIVLTVIAQFVLVHKLVG